MPDVLPVAEQDLVAALHRAALDPAGWQEFLLLLEQALPGVGASLFGIDTPRHRVIYATSGAGIDPAGLKRFADYYHAINPFTAFLAGIRPGATCPSMAHVADQALQRTEFYTDWMRHQDHLIGGVALKSAPHHDRSLIVAVNIRHQGRDQTMRRSQALLERLQPHVSHAFRVSEVIAVLGSQRLAAAAGNGPGHQGGTVITDRNLMVVWADPGMVAMLGGLLRIDRVGRLGFVDPQVQLWAEALGAAPGQKPALPGMVRTRDAGGWTIQAVSGLGALPASPLFPGLFRGTGWPEQHLVFVMSRPHLTGGVQRRLTGRFQLSTAEAEIAMLIAQGSSTAEIAQARRVSLHTVRNQIRAILHKMEAPDRGAIIREVMAMENGLR